MPARFAARRSTIHGRGVFALTDLAAEDVLIEYKGQVIAWSTAHKRYAASEAEAGHTYFFDLGDGRVIDGGANGNTARFFNHGCNPNCEAVDDDGRIWFQTTRRVRAGEELCIDYQLTVDDPLDDDERAAYACRCGAPNCRGTMLAE